jgi:hypothetical protein
MGKKGDDNVSNLSKCHRPFFTLNPQKNVISIGTKRSEVTEKSASSLAHFHRLVF